MKDVNALSELKLRVGYGVTGQQDIESIVGNYPYLARYTYGQGGAQYQFGNTFYSTLRPEGYSSGLKWESTATYNAGLDYGFLDGRLFGSVDVYLKKTKDLLALVSVPAGSLQPDKPDCDQRGGYGKSRGGVCHQRQPGPEH